MPELPDLQVFSYNLQKKVTGIKLQEIKVLVAKKINVSVTALQEALLHHQIDLVKRVGKELHFQFDNGHVLALHLMLHGELLEFKGEDIPNYCILAMIFVDGNGLALTDFQKMATPTLDPLPSPVPDALSPEINLAFFKNLLAEKKTTIKNILLDQKLIRGIGNAYADEILWDARISPFSLVNKIPEPKINALVKSIRFILSDAEKQLLKTHPDIISGEYRSFLKIHGPHIKVSPSGAEVLVKKTGSRKTYYTMEQELFL